MDRNEFLALSKEANFFNRCIVKALPFLFTGQYNMMVPHKDVFH